jgi:class 3 adenylate cyclase
MEREVRYCTTEDGVRIAYSTMGQGEPLVHLAHGFICHIQQEVRQPEIARWYGLLASRYLLVRYDERGFGSSQREPADVSLETMLRDLDAVIRHLGVAKVVLFGAMIQGAVAVAYAARFPERVSRLVLWSATPSGHRYRAIDVRDAMQTIAVQDWNAFTSMWMQRQWGWSRADQARRWSRMLRDSTDGETYVKQVTTFRSIDVSDLLDQVSAATLVVHPAPGAGGYYDEDASRALAGGIADARLVTLTGDPSDFVPWLSSDAAEEAFRVLTAFVEGAEAIAPPVGGVSGVRTVLFTDLVGHSEMMQRLGDERGRDVLREHERITRDTLRAHGGAEVKTMGDGFIASFASVTSAVECAVALQRAFAEPLTPGPSTTRGEGGAKIDVRIGINAGEPIEEEGDLFGATVILASRICAQAGPGEILVPETVRGLLAGKGFVFADRGEFVPKGFDDAVRLYDVRWREDA